MLFRDIAAVNAVGFDTEWVYKGGKRNPVALLQLATYSGICVVLRLNYLQGVPLSLKVSQIISTFYLTCFFQNAYKI